MIDRRNATRIIFAATVAPPIAARAQQAGAILPVIGFLNSQSPAGWEHFIAAFQQGLKDAGFEVGRNVAIDYRWAEGRVAALPGLAAVLVERKVAVIVATGGPDPVKAATATIPIVFTTGADPVALGLVESLARPGGNVTGFTLFTRHLAPKRLEILRAIVPEATSITMIVNPANSGSQGQVGELTETATQLGRRLISVEARNLAEIGAALDTVVAAGGRAVFFGSDAYFFAHRIQIVDMAAQRGVPAIYEGREFCDAGGLVSYGVSFADIYRSAGGYAARILRGGSPAEMPVQQPTRFELVINMKAAKALGLKIPLAVLLMATRLIE